MNKRLLYFILSILCLVIGVGVYYFFKKDILVYEAFIGIKKMNTEGYGRFAPNGSLRMRVGD